MPKDTFKSKSEAADEDTVDYESMTDDELKRILESRRGLSRKDRGNIKSILRQRRLDAAHEFFENRDRADAVLRNAFSALQQAGVVAFEGDAASMSRTAIRNVFKNERIYIYIDDLVRFGNSNLTEPPRVYHSLQELRRRCEKHGFYPLQDAKEGGYKDFLCAFFHQRRRQPR